MVAQKLSEVTMLFFVCGLDECHVGYSNNKRDVLMLLHLSFERWRQATKQKNMKNAMN